MKTILIAEDKLSSREMLSTVLEHAGYFVLQAENGELALELARAKRPDLLILDLQMPVLDGYGVASALRNEEAALRVPIIALTAYAMPGDRERALSVGFTTYLTKPVNLAILRQEIARLLESQ